MNERPPMSGQPPTAFPGEPVREPMDPRDLAALYAAGALEPSEVAAFEARVAAGDGAYVEALAEVRPALDAMLRGFEVAPPSAELSDAVMARVRAHAAGTDHDASVLVSRREHIQWRATGLPGVKSHTLLADKKNNRRTVLLKMEPGSYIPDHDHAGIEEVMVLEGDLSIGSIKLGPRDYFCAQAGARHGEPRTEHGCIALVFSSYGSLTTRTKLGFAVDVVKHWLGLKGRRSA